METNDGERVDTFHNLVTKDMVQKPDTTISMSLTKEELDVICEKVTDARLFQLPEPRGRESFVRLTVTQGRVTRSLALGAGELMPPWVTNSEWEPVADLISLIREIVESHPEFGALPPAVGQRL